MAAGGFDLNPPPVVLSSPALQTGVYLYTPTKIAGGNPYSLLPNITWTRIEYREGPDPPVCQLAYILDDAYSINLGWPSQFQSLWPIDAQGNYIVQSDARIVVLGTNPDGTQWPLFDGFAQIPQIDVTAASQAVTFAAQGVAVRCFDQPITGRVQRNSDAASINLTDGSADVETDLPMHFNPVVTTISDGNKGGYLPNRSPHGMDTKNNSIGDYPVFIEDGLEVTPDPRAYWSISGALKLILATYNEQETYVNVPTFAQLERLLQAEYPPGDGTGVFDPNNASVSPVFIRDYNAQNKCWPPVVAELISYAGFVMRWRTSAADDGLNPQTELALYRRDAATSVAPKRLYLAAAGNAVNPNTSNTPRLHLARDATRIVNAYQIETSQRRVEARFQLAPLYSPAVGDEITPLLDTFNSANWTSATTALTRRKYRWYGPDELGGGHWIPTGIGTGSLDTTPCDLSALFPLDGNGDPTYTRRYRPGSHALISLDSAGHPLKAVLQIRMPADNTNFNSGLQQPNPVSKVVSPEIEALLITIPHGWRLLPDRLGIEVTAQNPNAWTTGGKLAKINGVEWWANPLTTSPTFSQQPILILTTVIEDDLGMGITAGKRIASPSKYPKWRISDGRDHYQYNSVSLGSPYYASGGGNGTDPLVVRDDTDAAQTHANQLRAATEMPPVAGSVSIPYISSYYEIGDRLWKISGVSASLQTNVGASAGEAEDYPWIVGVSWTNVNNKQSTELQLSDHRATPTNL